MRNTFIKKYVFRLDFYNVLVFEIYLTPQIMYQQLTNIVTSFAGCFKYISTNFYRHKKWTRVN